MSSIRDALFILTLLILAAGMENKMIEGFDSQVGDKAADFFKQTFGQETEQQTEDNDKELTDE